MGGRTSLDDNRRRRDSSPSTASIGGPRTGGSLEKPAPSPSTQDRFVSPYLDPPLLNMVPGLPPLKLPLSKLSLARECHESPPAPPSPPSEACSTPASFDIPSPRRDYPPSSLRSSTVFSPACIATDFYPVTEASPEPSPQVTIASLPSNLQVSDVDSLILPPSDGGDDIRGDSSRRHFIQISPSASDMDAFALAAAVASSASRSSLSIPPSVQSLSGSPAAVDDLGAAEVLRPHAYRQVSEVSLGHFRPYPLHSPLREAHDSLTVDPIDDARARRRSAPPPTVVQSPRAPPANTVVSRVDVGERIASRKLKLTKSAKKPVLGKVRKFGERIRGLFKSKGDSPSKEKTGHVDGIPAYGLMTTTTAITNIEYESEHPIPIPSPRAKLLRNHRRSLPVPSVFIPSNPDHLSSAFLKRPSVSRTASSHPSETFAAEDPIEQSRGALFRTSINPTDSPHTPRPRRQRTQTAPQSNGNDCVVEDDRKARRFSLSSALSKSRLDTLRSAMMPRPPLPPLPPALPHDHMSGLRIHRNGESSFQTPSAQVSTAPNESTGGDYWGGELPSVQITRDSQDVSSIDESPRRVRTQTAPSGPHASPDLDPVTTTPKAKRPRRFSLSSMMARRSSRSHVAMNTLNSRPGENDVPELPSRKVSKTTFRRPRGDTVTTITQGVPFDMVQHIQDPQTPTLYTSHSNRFSVASSRVSSREGSAYFDAQEQLSEDRHQSSFEADRSCSPGPESDLDSMSFARTPDHSSGTFSFGSCVEHSRYVDTDDLSIPGSYHFRPSAMGRCASTSAVSQLVGRGESTPVTKTLRFSPSLSLSFERSWSDGEDDELGRMEREEERGFLRALGFEFDQIARRVREEPL
ncbi:hypothetical protein BD413DRAFT_100264 [Trametes elegans]|nr:hypothetical protein BD413DRAFT_100264 [Trametes elegans]